LERTLLERLRGASSGAQRMDRDAALRDSIRVNLERVLNSRQDLSAACPEYGLPELTAILRSLPEARSDIERAIQRCVETFEPRLTGVRVTYVDDPQQVLRAFFRITAFVVTEAGRAPVRFDTEVGWLRRDAGQGQAPVRVEWR
jgi:type VI secretion system protein